MRSLRDLTPDEQSAYRIWQAKLRDRTLSAAQHDTARREIDDILWRGPNSQVLALKAEIASLAARLERVEFHAGLNDAVVEIGHDYLHTDDAGPKVHALNGGGGRHVTLTPDGPSEPLREGDAAFPDTPEKRAAASEGLRQSVTYRADDSRVDPVVDVEGPAVVIERTDLVDVPMEDIVKADKETRGRKKLRFIPEKNANGGWMLLDREANGPGQDGEYLEASAFKTRKEAKTFTDDLNAGRIPVFLRGVEIPGLAPAETIVLHGERVDAPEGSGLEREPGRDTENPHDTENADLTDADLGF